MITRPCPSPLDGGDRAVRAGGVARRPGAAARAGAVLLPALFLAACGGGGGDAPPSPAPAPPPSSSPTEVPISATVDVASWVAFAMAQAPNDSIEPLTLDRIDSVPTSESDEPIVVP